MVLVPVAAVLAPVAAASSILSPSVEILVKTLPVDPPVDGAAWRPIQAVLLARQPV